MARVNSRRSRRVSVGLVGLVALSLAFSSCIGLGLHRSPCVEFGDHASLDFGLTFTRQEGTNKTYTAFLRMQKGVLETWSGIEVRRCAEVSADEQKELVHQVAVLAAEEPLRGLASGRETISWSLPSSSLSPRVRRSGLLAADELSPSGMAAMKEIACFAVAKVPKLTRNAIGGAAPQLARAAGLSGKLRAWCGQHQDRVVGRLALTRDGPLF